jgi:hypothetical protein
MHADCGIAHVPKTKKGNPVKNIPVNANCAIIVIQAKSIPIISSLSIHHPSVLVLRPRVLWNNAIMRLRERKVLID